MESRLHIVTWLCGVNLYIYHHVTLLWLNPFDLGVDREGWWFEHSVL